jgi:hypothetical protein
MKISYWLTIVFCSAFFHSPAQRAFRGIPDFITMHVGGSTGYISTGFGYTALNSKARFSAHYGIVPESKGRVINIIAAKMFYRPGSITVWNRVRLNPFDVGLIGSYHFGNTLHVSGLEGERAVDYTWWQSTWRVDMAMESSLTFEFPKKCFVHSITGLIDITTNEVYLIRTIRSGDTLHFPNMIMVGMGTRISF